MSDLQTRMTQMTYNYVCSQDALAAFVRLGVQMQYVYKTADQYVAFSPTVTACPSHRRSEPADELEDSSSAQDQDQDGDG